MPLSAEEVAQFRRDGYVCQVPAFMPAEEALALRQQLQAYQATQGGKLQEVQRSRAFLLFKWLERYHDLRDSEKHRMSVVPPQELAVTG
jgi:hypothetical protein